MTLVGGERQHGCGQVTWTSALTDEFHAAVFLVRANLVFVGIRHKHLGYKASKASPFYTTTAGDLSFSISKRVEVTIPEPGSPAERGFSGWLARHADRPTGE